MNGIKKGIMCMSIVIMVMCLCVGCSSSDKPSEDTMKNIIATIHLKPFLINKQVSELKFESFKITNGFFSKNKGGGGESTPYNIEVNYKYSYMLAQGPDVPKEKKVEERDNDRYWFNKKGDKWYGNDGWR
jgi:hypothetical protein